MENVTQAVNQLVEALYEADCAVNGLQIAVPRLSEDLPDVIETDYGTVILHELETV